MPPSSLIFFKSIKFCVIKKFFFLETIYRTCSYILSTALHFTSCIWQDSDGFQLRPIRHLVLFPAPKKDFYEMFHTMHRNNANLKRQNLSTNQNAAFYPSTFQT